MSTSERCSRTVAVCRGTSAALLFASVALGLVHTSAFCQSLVTLSAHDPGRAFTIISPDSATVVEGELPAGWNDQSTGWQKEAEVHYLRVLGDGEPHLHFEKVRGRSMELGHGLSSLGERSLFRLTLIARTTTGGIPRIGVRSGTSPYEFLWSATPSLDHTWRSYSYQFWFGPYNGPLELHISLAAVGGFDLKELTLERLAKADIVAELTRSFPDTTSANLVRVSRFPGGLPTGWFFNRFDHDGSIQTEVNPRDPGPSGFPALRIRTTTPFTLFSSPLPVWRTDKTHTLSLAIRSDSAVTVSIFSGQDDKLASAVIPATGKTWARSSITFTPTLGCVVHGLSIHSTGTIAIDALQLEQGQSAHLYRSPALCEIELTLPRSEASRAGIQFLDEPARIAYVATGACAGMTLRARAFDVYGDSSDIPPVALRKSSMSGGTFVLPFSTNRTGPIRVEAWIVAKDGSCRSPFDEIIVTRLHRPVAWLIDAPASPFGVHALSGLRALTLVKAIGANWVRLHGYSEKYVGWSTVEPERDRWNFYDDDIGRYRTMHLMILGQLETAPPWATGFPKAVEQYRDQWFQPREMSEWGTYVRTVVDRYKSMIHFWEVWNEPFNDFWTKYDPGAKNRHTRSATAAADFAQLQAVAFREARAADGTAKILGFNTYGSEDGRVWTRDILRQGGLSTCDILSYHRYTDDMLGWPGDLLTRNGFSRGFAALRDSLAVIPKSVWLTEGMTTLASSYDGMYRRILPYTNSDAYRSVADNTVRYVVRTLSQGTSRAFLYTTENVSYYFASGQPEWRTLVANDGSPHPSAAAYSALAWLVEGKTYAGAMEWKNGVFGFLFEGGGKVVMAVSPRPGCAEPKVPNFPGLTVFDLFGNPLPAGHDIPPEMSYFSMAGNSETMIKAIGGKVVHAIDDY